MTLHDAADLLEHRVRATIDALELTDADEAAKHLAIRYAKLIDESVAHEDPKIGAWAIRWVGPLLLDALGELGATPAARSRLKGNRPATAAAVSPLEQMRAAKAKRARQ